MIISDLNTHQISDRLSKGGLRFEIGPFNLNLMSDLPDVARHISLFYGDSRQTNKDGFCDFHVSMERPKGIRRWVKSQVIFNLDEFSPFKPLPLNQSFAMFEWGMNWCIATHAHHFLIVHSAVIEKCGKAIIMPGVPGSGKSTLCAALVNRGWRLLSDEMALIDPTTLAITPIPRPVALKNESIDIITGFSEKVVIGPKVADTAKGTVAHMRAPKNSLQRYTELAAPSHIVFPSYRENAMTALVDVDKTSTLMQLYKNAFNAHILGAKAFEASERLVSSCRSLSFTYSNLDDAIKVFDDLVA